MQDNPDPGQALLYLAGEGAGENISSLENLLQAFPQINSKLHAAFWHGDRRWSLRLKNGLEIFLPEQGADKALGKLLALQESSNLFEKAIARIDMRNPQHIIIRPLKEGVNANDSLFTAGAPLPQPKARAL